MTELRLPTAHISIDSAAVRCEFGDGSFSFCDITQSHGPKYREAAAFWGYADHVRYAQHHDPIHCWLWDRLHNRPSPTLWAEAHSLPPPPENRLEEHLVNHVQYQLALGGSEYASFFVRHIGADWAAVLLDLRRTLEDLGLPVPPREPMRDEGDML